MCSCCSIKCWFIFFNSVFLASGVTLIVIGAVQFSTYSHLGALKGSDLSKIAIVLIAVGVAIVLVSLLGYIGAFMDNISMLGCFLCILALIILSEVVAGAALNVLRSRTILLQMNSGFNTKTREIINKYSLENRLSINGIQEKFSCCGAETYTEWYKSVGWGKHDAVPDSCCVVKTPGCGQNMKNINKKGCVSSIKIFLLKNLLWVGAVCIALGIAEVFGFLVGLCLCLKIGAHRKYETMD